MTHHTIFEHGNDPVVHVEMRPINIDMPPVMSPTKEDGEIVRAALEKAERARQEADAAELRERMRGHMQGAAHGAFDEILKSMGAEGVRLEFETGAIGPTVEFPPPTKDWGPITGFALHESISGPSEAVDHPAHYGGDTVYEVIKVIEAWGLGFCLGNTVKYISRAGKKPMGSKLEDLRKARWYLDRELSKLEAEAEAET